MNRPAVLVTAASGYIGGRLVPRLDRGDIETDWAGAFPARPLDGTVSLEEHEGRIFERRSRRIHAPVAAVYATFAGIGGRRGWCFGNAL